MNSYHDAMSRGCMCIALNVLSAIEEREKEVTPEKGLPVNQIIKIKPPKCYRWVEIGEVLKQTDLWAYELRFDGRGSASVSIEWRLMPSPWRDHRCNSFQSYIRLKEKKKVNK